MYKITLSELSLIMKEKFSDFAKSKLITMKPCINKDDERIPDVEFHLLHKNELRHVYNEIVNEAEKKMEVADEKDL